MGRPVIQYPQDLVALQEIIWSTKPDLIIILGDKYEIFSVAIAALLCKIPIGHLHGGEATEGAIDEAIRHSITKMSHVHFVSNERAKKLLIRMGESTKNIYKIGSPEVDIMLTILP